MTMVWQPIALKIAKAGGPIQALELAAVAKTRRDRMSAKLREIKDELRRRRHWPMERQ